MLLDAWLRLAILGPLVLFAVLLGVLVLGFALFRAAVACRRQWQEGEIEQAGLIAVLVVLLVVPIAAVIVAAFVDTRTQMHLELDFKKPQHMLLTELRRCADQSNTACDSSHYAVTATVILPDNRRLKFEVESLIWSIETGARTSDIQIRDANTRDLTLQAGHKLFMRHVNELSPTSDSEKQRIDEVSTWLLKCCEDNKFYSKTVGIELTHQLGLQLYNNVDRVAVDYVLKPQP